MVVQMDGFRKSYLLQQRLSQITGSISKKIIKLTNN